MKTALFILSVCILCSTAALAQQSVSASPLNPQPIITQFDSHPNRAIQTPMAKTENLQEQSTYLYAQGERPLWEVHVPVPVEMPLGDVARMLRKEHALSKRASIVVSQ
jgi:hypothetical protein